MRTKSIILGAAVLAAGVTASMAQAPNVYSVNVVGYVNVPLTNGFNLIANPLDGAGSGTATSNTITTVFGSQLPSLTQVYKFANGTFGTSDQYLAGVGWLGGGTITFNPGEGLFVSVPAGQNPVVTFAGTVCQSNIPTSVIVKPGFNIISSQAPISGGITSVLGYQPQNEDQVYVWSSAAQTYPSSYEYLTGVGWLGGEPTLSVGQAIFIDNQTATTNTWVNSFTVQ